MKKIDRLGWAAGIAFVSHGLRIGIRASSPQIMDRLHTLLPPNAKPARGPRVECLYSLIVRGTKVGSNVRRFNILYADAVQLVRTKDTDQVLEALETDLQLYVAERARRRVFVHAGVVGWHGRATRSIFSFATSRAQPGSRGCRSSPIDTSSTRKAEPEAITCPI